MTDSMDAHDHAPDPAGTNGDGGRRSDGSARESDVNLSIPMSAAAPAGTAPLPSESPTQPVRAPEPVPIDAPTPGDAGAGSGAGGSDRYAGGEPPVLLTEVAPLPRHNWPGIILQSVLVIGFLGASAYAMQYLLNTRPVSPRRPAVRQAVLVEAMPVAFDEHVTKIEAYGTVQPSRQTEIHPRVRGEILRVHRDLEDGRVIPEKAEVARIDPEPYEMEVTRLTQILKQRQAQLALERGNQAVAERELELMGQQLSPEERDRVLRKPQLDIATAEVDAAQAVLDRANLDLKWTSIRSPFDAVVRQRHVTVGGRVTEGDAIATLAAADRFWIETTVPTDRLSWLTIPRRHGDPASSATVTDPAAWDPGESRTGHVLRLGSDLESQGRMARVIVCVDDPLVRTQENRESGLPRLILDSWVRVVLDGKPLRAVAVPVDVIRDGAEVWVVTPERTLDIRRVTIRFRTRDLAYVTSGLADGDLVITSPLGSPVQGMKVRLPDDPIEPEGIRATAGGGSQ